MNDGHDDWADYEGCRGRSLPPPGERWNLAGDLSCWVCEAYNGRRYAGLLGESNLDNDVMSQTDHSERWEVHFSGQVQGVGFRYTTRSLASRFPLTGYVKNLPDGRVEMGIEGDSKILRRLVSLIETEMSGYINQTQIAQSNPTGEFTSFEIAH